MARDYKYHYRTRRKSGPPAWVWSVIGLLVGLFVAFLVYLQMRPQTRTAEPRPAPLEIPSAQDSRELRKKESEPVPPPPRPRFDFYDLLPEMEVVVPEQELQGAPTPEGVKQVQQPGTYLLQAGSFRSQEQADQLRARLALLGLETSIQTVSVNNRQTWHRVRVGPYRNLTDLNRARALLKQNGVDAILIRLKS
jgi:cell division protein FtsN